MCKGGRSAEAVGRQQNSFQFPQVLLLNVSHDELVVSLGKVLAAEPAVEAGAFLPQGVAVSAPSRRVHEAQNVLGVD